MKRINQMFRMFNEHPEWGKSYRALDDETDLGYSTICMLMSDYTPTDDEMALIVKWLLEEADDAQ